MFRHIFASVTSLYVRDLPRKQAYHSHWLCGAIFWPWLRVQCSLFFSVLWLYKEEKGWLQFKTGCLGVNTRLASFAAIWKWSIYDFLNDVFNFASSSFLFAVPFFLIGFPINQIENLHRIPIPFQVSGVTKCVTKSWHRQKLIASYPNGKHSYLGNHSKDYFVMH